MGGGGGGGRERIGKFAEEDFLLGEVNLTRSDFGDSKLFQRSKQLSVNAEHQLKSELP